MIHLAHETMHKLQELNGWVAEHRMAARLLWKHYMPWLSILAAIYWAMLQLGADIRPAWAGDIDRLERKQGEVAGKVERLGDKLGAVERASGRTAAQLEGLNQSLDDLNRNVRQIYQLMIRRDSRFAPQ